MQSMNVLLIDNSSHLQKTLQYFLHPYAPSFYSIDSQEELPRKIDIVFLDSEHKNNKYTSRLKNKKEQPPVVLISRDEKTLQELSAEYSAVLKKPVQYNQLQEIIHHLIPETRSFKASSFLKFYEKDFEQEEPPLSLSSPKENLQAAVEESSLHIPLVPEKDLKGLKTEKEDELKTEKENELKSKNIESKSPNFNNTQTIIIPDDMKLVDEMDSTSLHQTNTFLKKVSEKIKDKLNPLTKADEKIQNKVKNTKKPPESAFKENNIHPPQNSHSEISIDEGEEELTISQTPSEKKSSLDPEKISMDSSEISVDEREEELTISQTPSEKKSSLDPEKISMDSSEISVDEGGEELTVSKVWQSPSEKQHSTDSEKDVSADSEKPFINSKEEISADSEKPSIDSKEEVSTDSKETSVNSEKISMDSSEISVDEREEELTVSKIWQSPSEKQPSTDSEKGVSVDSEKPSIDSKEEVSTDSKETSVNSEKTSMDSKIDTKKPQVFSTPSEFKNMEKWDTLSDRIVEIIDKHFQDKWESFVNTQLKKDLKNMIHKEVAQIFKEQIKDILTTEGIQSIKKASEEISWKVIPELSKQIIQKEIKKLLNKP